jgi:hypothetical protein
MASGDLLRSLSSIRCFLRSFTGIRLDAPAIGPAFQFRNPRKLQSHSGISSLCPIGTSLGNTPIQLIEDLRRVDIHELNEEIGYRSLMELKADFSTVQTIPAQVANSPPYVIGRISLTEMTPARSTASLPAPYIRGFAKKVRPP